METPFKDVIETIPEHESPGHGSHWNFFFDDNLDLGCLIPQIIQEAQLALTYRIPKAPSTLPCPPPNPRLLS